MTSFWWEKRWIAYLSIAFCALPILVTTIPPLGDLPGHMASYHVALVQGQPNPLHRFFSLDWHVIGNLGADLLIMPVGKVIGVEAGTKLIALLIPVMTAAALFAIARADGDARSPVIYAAVPLAYNYPFLFGFVNYSLSAAMALFTFAWWLRWEQRRRPVLRFATFALLAMAVWLAHAIGWLILGTLVGAAELHRHLREGRRATALPWTIKTCLPLLAAVPLNFLSPRTGGLTVDGFIKPGDTAKWIISLFRDRWLALDVLSFGFVGVILAAACLGTFKLRINNRLGWPALALLGLYLLLPQSINDSHFVAGRVAPYVAAMALLSVSVERASPVLASRLAAICMCFLMVRIAANTASFALYDREYRREIAALDYVPIGGTVIALTQTPCVMSFKSWYNPRNQHLPALAIVRRNAFANAAWAIPGLQLLTVHYPAAGAFASDPSQAVHLDACSTKWRLTLAQALASLPYSAFQRLWLLNIPRERWPTDPRLKMLWSSEDSVIYEIKGINMRKAQ